MEWKAVFFCLVLGMLASHSPAATINVHAGDDLAGAISSAKSGDIVVVGAGEFVERSPIVVPSGVTVTGVSPDASHIDFHIAGDDATSYGFVLPPNASDVTIEELDLKSNHGVISMELGSQYSNILISHNNIAYGAGQLSDGTDVFGITGTIPNDGLQIVHNFFHDSPNTARNWCIWYASNANFDYNQFNNITDGGQIDSPGPNVSFSYNYGTYIHRMGQEVAIGSDSNFLCTGNVFYDYVNPYNDSEGVSIVGGWGKVDITNNFFEASIAPGSSWGQRDSGGTHRFGYAIECTGKPCSVTGNTIVGSWAECASSDTPKARINNNNIFGQALWGDFEGEPGPSGGYGSVRTADNQIDPNVSDAPPPPANTNAGPRKHSL